MIREFVCPSKHVSEAILTPQQDSEFQFIACKCGQLAKKVEFSLTATPQFKVGCGGFYHPSQP